MANIRETLTLEDKFSATFTKYLNLGGQAANASALAASASQNYQSVLSGLDQRLILLNAEFDVMMQKQNQMAAAGQQNTAAFATLDNRMERLGGTIRSLTAQYDAVEAQAKEAAKAADQYAQSSKKAGDASDGLTRKLKSLAGSYIGLQGLKAVLNLSDQLSSTTARLDMMNDGLQTTDELNQMIFESAQRSRGAYLETANFVSKLGNLAGEAFSSNEEIIDFAEQINKQITLSGASSTEASAAIYQLTQALSSGALRGEELNSVMEQTPMIAKTIADYMGVSTGELRELASQGAVTADVVKNAMFAAAEETNAKFEEMPMTWGQVWTQFQNSAIQAFQPVLEVIGWFADNIEIISPLIIGVAVAFGVLAAAVGIYNGIQAVSNTLSAISAARSALKAGATLAEAAATTTATGAQVGLNIALLACPITWIVLGIIAIIAVIYAVVAAINEFAGTSISATGVIAGVFAVLGAFLFNRFVVPAQNAFAAFANFIGNLFNDPVAAVKILFYDMMISVLGFIQNIAQGIENVVNWIPGVKVELTGGIDRLVNDVTSAKNKAKEESGWKEYIKPWEYIDYEDAYQAGYDWGANLFSGSEDAATQYSYTPEVPDYTPQLDNISSSVGSIEKSVSGTEEDIQSLVDIAERRYVNNINLTAQTPVINISGANTGNTRADRQNLANTIRDILVEQVSAGSVRTTARAF